MNRPLSADRDAPVSAAVLPALLFAATQAPGDRYRDGVGFRTGTGSRALLRLSLVAFCLVSGLTLVPAAAQDAPAAANATPPEVDPLTPAEIDARHDAVKSELETLRRELAALPDPSAERDRLSDIRIGLLAIEDLLRKERDLAEPDTTQKATKGTDAVPTPLPQSIFTLNELYERQLKNESRLATRSADRDAARETLATARQRLEERKRDRRAARQAVEAAAPGEARAAAEHALRRADVDVRKASENVHLRTLEARTAQRKLAATEAKAHDLESAIEQSRATVAKAPTQLGDGLAELTRREGNLRREREALERELATADLRLEAAQRRFAKVADPPGELLEEVESLTLRRDVVRQQIAATDAQLERLGTQRDDWGRWANVLANRASRQELRQWQDAAEEKIAAIEAEELQRQGRSADVRQQLEDVEARLAATPEGGKARRFIEERRDLLNLLLEVQSADDRDLAANRRISERLLDALRNRRGHFDVIDYAQRVLASLRAAWRYELTAVNEDPITLGSLITALLLAVLGFVASRRLAAAVGRLAGERLHLERGAAAALQTLAFYVLLAGFTLLALRAVSFPLTAFTVLGGALAIGVGFGSQNVMNNFISGLILMLERPVRALDLVEVDGNHGTVERIGARSTQIRSTDGRHIIVPNSFFLENNVVNWTLSDDLIRAEVRVGVAYGSPSRLVEKLLREVVDANRDILRNPEPMITFADFGDNALVFDTYFWVRARTPAQVRKVQSDVRFHIDEIFREHNLTIAFPQRDVHVESVSPLEIRLVEGRPKGGAES